MSCRDAPHEAGSDAPRAAVAGALRGVFVVKYRDCKHESSKFCILATCSANVAQLVEQLIRNQQVRGSSPLVGSIKRAKAGSSKADGPLFLFALQMKYSYREERDT